MTITRLVLAAVLVAGTACVKLVAEDGAPAMCLADADCSQGERCRQGLCVGPPSSMLAFAAELVPPETRSDLALTDTVDLAFTPQGEALGLDFANTVELSGRVVLSSPDQLSVAAKLVFRRPSLIPGGPPYVAIARSERGRPPGESSFSVRLPPNLEMESYELVVYPDDGTLYEETDVTTTPAAAAPPLRVELALLQDQRELVFTLSPEQGLKRLGGRVTDAAARGIAGMRVRATGAFAAGGPVDLRSSLGVTDAGGGFSILVPIAGEDLFHLAITPGADVRAPTLKIPAVFVEDPVGPYATTKDIPDIVLPSYPAPVEYLLPVSGAVPEGGTAPAAGARMTLKTVLSDASGSAGVISYEETATVAEDGIARAWLIPGTDGNRRYDARIEPLPTSPHGWVWTTEVATGPTGGVVAEIVLPSRVYVAGQLSDGKGYPAGHVVVQARPSAFFALALDEQSRGELDRLSLPQTETDENGRFGIYLDRLLLGQPAYYDLDLSPPYSGLMPRWSIERVFVGDASGAKDLGLVALPDATYTFATVRDDRGVPVSGAEVRVYTLSQESDLCAPQGATPCQPPARLRALARSDAYGEVLLVLPAPPTSSAVAASAIP